MTDTAIFWPMIAHVVLVVVLYALLGVRRAAAIKAGRAKTSQFRENLNEPADSLFVRNCLSNQFELPVLFHAACLALHVTGGEGPGRPSWPGCSSPHAMCTPSSTSRRTASATASPPSRPASSR